MLARVRTTLDLGDLWPAPSLGGADPVAAFEQAFAEHFGFPHGLLFPYGRSALYALLTALDWREREVLCPAYTCVVIPHAVTSSGNRVTYVDSASDHFLPSVAEWQAAVTPRAAMAVLTPLFGYPVDERCAMLIRRAAPRSFILYDEAQSYGAKDKNGLQIRQADGALFSLGLGKLLTSLKGGMLLLRDGSVDRAVRAVRDRYAVPTSAHILKLIIKGIMAWIAYREPAVTIFEHVADRFTQLSITSIDWDISEEPGLPKDGQVLASAYQARIGIRQLLRFEQVLAARQRIGEFYDRKLREEGFLTFPYAGLPTWPRFPFAVADRRATIQALRKDRIQLGLFLSSACADLPNATRWGRSMINLPNWQGLDVGRARSVVDALSRLRDRDPKAIAWPNVTQRSAS